MKGDKVVNLLQRPTITFVIICLICTLCSNTVIGSMTIKEEKELGERLALQIQQNVEMVDDPIVNVYIEEVGRRLTEAARDRRFDYRFYVVREQEPNAFAIPGGHIFLTSGLIRFVETEEELAGVIGHEIAHSVLRHMDKALDRARRLSLLTLAAIIAGAFLTKDVKGAATLSTGAMAMAQSLMLKYTRENEIEADQKGMRYLIDAGYPPQGILAFLKKIYRWQRAISPEIPTYLSTHPAVDERISYLSDTLKCMAQPLSSQPPAAGDLRKIQVRLFIKEKGGGEGISHFLSQLRERPNESNLLYAIGVSYVNVGRPREAITYLAEAERLSPGDVLVRRELGIAYFQAKEIDKALELLSEAIDAFPRDTTTLFYLAQGNQEMGHWDKAIFFYQRMLDIEPKRTEVYYNLGVIYNNKGALDLAHQYFGLYFREKGMRESALYHFRQALEHAKDPEQKRRLERLLRECEGKKGTSS